jgi:putative flippase GtrA
LTLVERIAASKFLRFGTVGAGGYVVDNAVLYVMTHVFRLDPYTGRIFSYLGAATFTWFGNRYLTFADRRAHGARAVVQEWLTFLLANAVGGAVNFGLYALLVKFAPAPLNNLYIALACGVAAGLVFNFTLSRRLVFRQQPPVA